LDADRDILYPLDKKTTHLIREDDIEVCSLEVIEKRMDDVIIASTEGNLQDDIVDLREEW
jgi:hypothetical protein